MGSLIFVNVGQCGNQIGRQFWDIVDSQPISNPAASVLIKNQFSAAAGNNSISLSTASSLFSIKNRVPRCLMLDTEPKVLRSMIEKGFASQYFSSNPNFRKENLLHDRSGRGNNWALGYSGGTRNPNLKDLKIKKKRNSNDRGGKNDQSGNDDDNDDDDHWKNIGKVDTRPGDHFLKACLESIRKEAERTDFVSGLVLTHSMSGGSGAGLGSRLLRELRDSSGFEKTNVLAASVAPFSVGDTPLQNYNSVLTINSLQEHADAIFLFQNDDLLRILSSRKVPVEGGESVSLFDINMYVASGLAGLFLPMKNQQSNGWRSFEVFDLVSNLFSMPWNKFGQVLCSPFFKKSKGKKEGSSKVAASWNLIAENICKQISKFDRENKIIQSISSQVFIRGDSDSSFLPEFSKSIRNTLSQSLVHVNWNPHPIDFKISQSQSLINKKYQPSMTICTNRGNLVQTFETILEKARLQFEAKAYLHFYEKYGCHSEIFEEAFEKVQSIIDSYRELLI